MADIFRYTVETALSYFLYHNLLVYSLYQYIKIFVVRPSVRPCVMDVGVAVTNLRVVCKIITCVSAFTEMAII